MNDTGSSNNAIALPRRTQVIATKRFAFRMMSKSVRKRTNPAPVPKLGTNPNIEPSTAASMT